MNVRYRTSFSFLVLTLLLCLFLSSGFAAEVVGGVTGSREAEQRARADAEAARDAIQGLDHGAAQVRLQVDDGVPELMADPHQLRQLFTNLLTNAIEAIGPGDPVDVRISYLSEDAEPAGAGQPLQPIVGCRTSASCPR